MISFADYSITYPTADTPTLSHVDMTIDDGQLCVVTGPTGSGKSTLLGAINGLVPHFTGGRVSGSVVVDGRDMRDTVPGAMADLVGYVGQDPQRGFVAETVEYELAYGMEQAGIESATMRARVEETLDIVGIAHLRGKRLTELSGGEQQRVAIGSVLTLHPRILVLDEPTSALDPAAAEDVLAAITRLVHDMGLTVVIAEHRLERVIQYADQVVLIERSGSVTSGEPRSVLESSPVVPPVVELGRAVGWDPLPLTVRDARRQVRELQARIDISPVKQMPPGTVAASAEGVSVTYGQVVAVRDVTLDLRRGEVTVVMGRNGSGKSSLFWALQGSLRPDYGAVEANGTVGLVPQTPADLLFLGSVKSECAQADVDADRDAGACRELLDRIAPGVAEDSHPRDLSEGQRLALVLSTQLVAEPDVVLLDEPTRGLDYAAKESLTEVLRRLAGEGKAVVLSTHDVEFAALVADRVVIMAEGEVVADGCAADILTGTPLFAPQVARVMAPLPVLTVRQVKAAIA